jgi:protocadherin-16/23
VLLHYLRDQQSNFNFSFFILRTKNPNECLLYLLQVSATDPDCGVNAMVNYTMGEGLGKLREFHVKSATGEVCIAAQLDFETRSVFEFPVIATDRGKSWLRFIIHVYCN